MAAKRMSIAEALQWIRFHQDGLGSSPTIIGKPDTWILKAGQLCRRKFLSPNKWPPVTDDIVRAALGGTEEPSEAML